MRAVTSTTHDDVDVEILAEHFDLELEVELEVLLLVQLAQHVHDAHRPRVVRPEDLAVRAALHHLGHERHDVEQLLRAFLVRLVEQALQVNVLCGKKKDLVYARTQVANTIIVEHVNYCTSQQRKFLVTYNLDIILVY